MLSRYSFSHKKKNSKNLHPIGLLKSNREHILRVLLSLKSLRIYKVNVKLNNIGMIKIRISRVYRANSNQIKLGTMGRSIMEKVVEILGAISRSYLMSILVRIKEFRVKSRKSLILQDTQLVMFCSINSINDYLICRIN